MNANEYTIKRVRKLLKENNVLQKQLAIELKIPVSNLNSYLRGQSEFRSDVIVKIAKFFNVSTDYLLGVSEMKSEKNFDDSIEKLLETTFSDINDLKKFIDVIDTSISKIKIKKVK